MGFDGFILEEPKPPPFILWIIGLGSCLLFAASAVLIVIGAVYAYGAIGMTLVGCGAVLYFATMVALVLSCIHVQKRYPGRRLLPSRLMPGRTVRRLSILANPHTSGSAPEKASKGQQQQEPPSASNPQEVNAHEAISPAVQNPGDSAATQETCAVNVDPTNKESAVDEQQKPTQKDTASSDPRYEELAASATTSDIQNGEFHLHHQQASLTPQSDSPQEGNDTASTASISSLGNSTVKKRQDQHLQEPAPSVQCAADVSSMLPAIADVPVSKENQDEQLGSVHSTPKPSTDVKEQVVGPSPSIKKTEFQDTARAPEDMHGAALNSNDSDVTPDSTLSCDHVTDLHYKQAVPSSNVSLVTSFSVEENSISYTMGPNIAKPELLHELHQHPKDAVHTVPSTGEVNNSLAESPSQILKSALSKKQHPYSEDRTAQRSEAFTSSLHNSPATERNFICHQSQHLVTEDTSPKVQRSVNFASATPPSPTSRRKEIPLLHLDEHQPDVSTTASGSMERVPGSFPSHEAHVSHLELQPEHCDDTMPSVLNYQCLDNTMPPPLPAKRRHSSFHAQTQELEFVLPTGMYDESTTATLPAFSPSRRRYLSDHEQNQHHQEVCLSTSCPREPTREPDTSAPCYRKLRTHRSQGRNSKDMPSAPPLHSTVYETEPTELDTGSRIMATSPRQYRHNRNDTAMVNPHRPCSGEQGRNCKDMPPAPLPRSTEYESAPTTLDSGSRIKATLPRHYRHNHNDISLVNPHRPFSGEQGQNYKDVPPAPPARSTEYESAPTILDAGSRIQATLPRHYRHNHNDTSMVNPHRPYSDVPPAPPARSTEYESAPTTLDAGSRIQATLPRHYRHNHNDASLVNPHRLFSVEQGQNYKDVPSAPPLRSTEYERPPTTLDAGSRIQATLPRHYRHNHNDTSLVNPHRPCSGEQGQNYKDVPPAPPPRSTEYESTPTTLDAGSRIKATLPRHYRHNHNDTSLVNPHYSNFVPSRTVALPRSASALVLNTSQHRHLGTVRQTPPSRHFGSSVAAPRPGRVGNSGVAPRPGHMRNLTYHRQYHEY